MNADDLLEALGRAQRDADTDEWGAWEAHAEGAPAPDDDADRVAAFAPMDDETLDRFTDRALDAVGATSRVAKRRIGPPIIVALAAAAAVLLVFLPREPDPLPAFRLQVRGGDQTHRNEAELTVRRLSPESRLEIVLTPETRADPVVRAELIQGDAVSPWVVTPEVSERGAIRIAGSAHELFGERRGAMTIRITLRADDEGPPQHHELNVELLP
ncbi:MAG: hypothetical protein AAGE52_37255 [Myxococcota bacterium]